MSSDNPYAEPNYVINKNRHSYSKIKGTPSDGVKWVQFELVRLGYDIGKGVNGEAHGIDGYFGDKTERAVISFQKSAKAEGIYNGELDGSVYLKTIKAFKSI